MEQNSNMESLSKELINETVKEITGCRFSLYPMDDNFVSIILGALEKTDTSAVWSQSDALSTLYRGKLHYVMDAVKGLFMNAWRKDVHMSLEGQISKGCPGDTAGEAKLNSEGEAPNMAALQDTNFPALCKLSLYPMGTGNYMNNIENVVSMAEEKGLKPETIHYATRINGDIKDIFEYLESVCQLMEASVPHFILHFTISVNSPTNEEEL